MFGKIDFFYIVIFYPSNGRRTQSRRNCAQEAGGLHYSPTISAGKVRLRKGQTGVLAGLPAIRRGHLHLSSGKV